MKIDIFKQNWQETIIKNKQLFLLNISLIILCLILAFKILITKEKIILVPPKINKDIVIQSNYANKDYYIQMGLFLTSLIGNQTPENSSFLMNILLKYFAPDAYQKLKEQIMDQILMLKDRGISMTFYPGSVYLDDKKHTVYVSGLQQYKSGKNIEKEVKITYEIKFKISDYKIYVVDFIAHFGELKSLLKGRKYKAGKVKKSNKKK